jgi:hypothetical protein
VRDFSPRICITSMTKCCIRCLKGCGTIKNMVNMVVISAIECAHISGEIEIGCAASDLSSRYHIVTGDGTVEYRAVVQNSSTPVGR